MAPRLINLIVVLVVLALIFYALNTILDLLIPLCFMAGVIYVFFRLKKDGRI
jgi:lipopolysaccharide export LptBFGC system permease protein LptF